MSWEAYIKSLEGSGNIQKAAIGNSTSVWANSDGFNITANEMKGLEASCDAMYQNGVMLGGQKFRILRHNFNDSEDPHLQLKSAKDSEGKTFPATVYKTNTGYVIGVGGPDAQPGKVTIDVFNTGSYLKKSGL
ncbi:hypothetical protein NQD34_018283 [Periophthalmus magnuspinnatus]|uniref:uncharacterized protein LOC117386514 n=1 Tax=Periophthalmus magnuspinnatus TaxID=409849 RepID=UPI00145B91B4|nr:uncharacterized protein LOC117386514 [Periophthalmus magnuspinnatus]KAI9999365.1 hypothetical protein NQD34_018283 [Periophthalmus magnuspinnatus]